MSLLVVNSVNQSQLKSLIRTPLGTALNSKLTGVPGILSKAIFFIKTIPNFNIATIQAVIDVVKANEAYIMFHSSWGQDCYVYNLDTFPVFDFANGGRNSNLVMNDVQWFPNASGHGLIGGIPLQHPRPPYTIGVSIIWYLVPSTLPFPYSINRAGHSGVDGAYSASRVYQWWPPPGIPFIANPTQWPGLKEFSAPSEDPIPDQDGLPSYPAQMVRVPTPDALGIIVVGEQTSLDGPYIPQDFFGEFRNYNIGA